MLWLAPLCCDPPLLPSKQATHMPGVPRSPSICTCTPRFERLRLRFTAPMACLPAAATNLQHEIDRAVQRVVEAVAAAQSVAGSGPPGVVTFDAPGAGGGSLPPLDVYRPVSPRCVPGCLSTTTRKTTIRACRNAKMQLNVVPPISSGRLRAIEHAK